MSYVVSAIEWFFLAYFVLFNAGYISLNLMALPTLRRKIALRPVEDLPAVYSGLEPPVSLWSRCAMPRRASRPRCARCCSSTTRNTKWW
jgi:hypothetical protein